MHNSRSVKAVTCLSIVSLTFLAGGCATYSNAPKSFSHSRTRLTVALPPNWLRFNQSLPTWVLTKDGLQLEIIAISVIRTGEKMKDTDRRYQKGMLPFEIAELSLAILKTKDEVNDLKIDKIELASIAGRDGYSASATFVDGQGLPKKLLLYGAMIDDFVCEFCFAAEESVYFDKYKGDFERLLASVTTRSR